MLQLIFAVVLLASAGGGGLLLAQGQEIKHEERWRPATIPADAVKFGAALEEQAPPEVKKWAQSYANKEMRERAVDPKATMAAVDTHFPQASEEARDAITFLLFYTAYKDEDENQKMLAIRIRDIDRETIEITRQLQMIWKNEQNRSASPMQTMTIQQRIQQEEEINKREAQLREYADERQLKSTQLVAARKKVNLYLKVLGITYPRMKGIEPAILRTVHSP